MVNQVYFVALLNVLPTSIITNPGMSYLNESVCGTVFSSVKATLTSGFPKCPFRWHKRA